MPHNGHWSPISICVFSVYIFFFFRRLSLSCFHLLSIFRMTIVATPEMTSNNISKYECFVAWNSESNIFSRGQSTQQQQRNRPREQATIKRFGICKIDVKRVNSSRIFLKYFFFFNKWSSKCYRDWSPCFGVWRKRDSRVNTKQAVIIYEINSQHTWNEIQLLFSCSLLLVNFYQIFYFSVSFVLQFLLLLLYSH